MGSGGHDVMQGNRLVKREVTHSPNMQHGSRVKCVAPHYN